jgi:sensor histidine kinase YesM
LNGGIGLKNTRERLQTLYGSKHHFELVNHNGLTVRISLPYTAAPVSHDIVRVG